MQESRAVQAAFEQSSDTILQRPLRLDELAKGMLI